MRIGDRKRSGEVEIVRSEVACALNEGRRALTHHDRSEGDCGRWICNLSYGVVASIGDEEIGTAIDRDTDRIIHLGEIGRPAVSGIPRGSGSEDRCDVASVAGGGGEDGVDEIRGGVGDVEIAGSVNRERRGGEQCSSGRLARNRGGRGPIACDLMENAGLVEGVDEVASSVCDVESAIKVDGKAAGRDEAGGEDTARSGGVDLDNVVG